MAEARRPTAQRPEAQRESDMRFQMIYTAYTEYLYKLVKLIGDENIPNTLREQLIEMFKQNICKLVSLDIRKLTPESLLEELRKTIDEYADFQKVLMDTSEDSSEDTADKGISDTCFLTLKEFKHKYGSVNMRALVRTSHLLSHITLRLVEKTSDSRESFVMGVETAFMNMFKLLESSKSITLPQSRELSLENLCEQVNEVIKLSMTKKKFWL